MDTKNGTLKWIIGFAVSFMISIILLTINVTNKSKADTLNDIKIIAAEAKLQSVQNTISISELKIQTYNIGEDISEIKDSIRALTNMHLRSTQQENKK